LACAGKLRPRRLNNYTEAERGAAARAVRALGIGKIDYQGPERAASRRGRVTGCDPACLTGVAAAAGKREEFAHIPSTRSRCRFSCHPIPAAPAPPPPAAANRWRRIGAATAPAGAAADRAGAAAAAAWGVRACAPDLAGRKPRSLRPSVRRHGCRRQRQRRRQRRHRRRQRQRQRGCRRRRVADLRPCPLWRWLWKIDDYLWLGGPGRYPCPLWLWLDKMGYLWLGGWCRAWHTCGVRGAPSCTRRSCCCHAPAHPSLDESC
jgi:hypothetical protein